MPDDEALSELRALDAIASERGAVLAFRMCEQSGALEPVFLTVFSANPGEENQAAMIDIGDQSGLSLGRYVISRASLEQALARAEEVGESEQDPAVVPLDWELS
jgi:hypothetical protein